MSKSFLQIDVDLANIDFKEHGLYFIYSPALDITGYGKTKAEARNSYKVAVDEFIEYTYHRGTLMKELVRLGWKVSKKKNITTQTLSSMFRTRAYLEEIFTEKKFHKTDETLSLPTLA